MTDIVQSTRIPIDLCTGTAVLPMRAKLMKGDRHANRVIAEITDGGKAVDLTGCLAKGSFFRPGDRAEIRLGGEISGNAAAVQLTDACYAEEGSYELRIKLERDGVERTILCISGDVHASGSGAYLDVDNVIPSIDEIIAQYQTMQAVTEEAREAAEGAQLWADANIDVQELEPGEKAYVVVTDVEGVRLIQMGIPRGKDGSIVFEELTPEQMELLRGPQGPDGNPGANGTSVTVKSVSESSADGGSNVVTFSDGKTVTIKNGKTGAAGADGAAGKDGTNGVGVSSVKQTTTSSADGGSNVVTVTLTNGTTSTFTVKNGSKGSTGATGAAGKTPVKGTDYWTAADQASMVQQVIAALPVYNGEVAT